MRKDSYDTPTIHSHTFHLYSLFPPSTPKAQENGSASFCVFWDQSIDEEYGGWSTEGCKLLQEEEQMAVCTCNHLTSFALLVVSALRYQYYTCSI